MLISLRPGGTRYFSAAGWLGFRFGRALEYARTAPSLAQAKLGPLP